MRIESASHGWGTMYDLHESQALEERLDGGGRPCGFNKLCMFVYRFRLTDLVDFIPISLAYC